VAIFGPPGAVLAFLFVVLALGASATASQTLATATVIRVGGPSAPGDAKIAIVASDRNLGGEAFRVTQGNRTVLRGRLRAAAGGSAPWKHAFEADLSSLRLPGNYRVHAGDVSSRSWQVAANGSASLVPLVLRFFRTQRDGNEPALLHRPAHLHDAVVLLGPHKGERIDMAGGWMDAGDMIHFTQTTAYATILLQAAARLDPANRTALNAEADRGVRWLLKAHPFENLFVTQVGGDVDHDVGFRKPEADDRSKRRGIGTRFAYSWGTKVGGDLGGRAAAALAMAAERSPEPKRSQLITAAGQWYAVGKAARRATPAIFPDPNHPDGSGGFYVIDAWTESIASGAAALYRVTGTPSYLTDAVSYLKRSRPLVSTPIYTDSIAPVAAADICGGLGAPPLGGQADRKIACAFLRDAAGASLDYSRQNAFGPAGYFQWGTTGTSSGGGAQAAMAADAAGFRPGRAIAAGARDWLLGRNAWGASFIAGFGPQNPRRVHHWGHVFGARQPIGAVVGGPAPLEQICGQDFGAPAGPFRTFNSGPRDCKGNVPESALAYEDKREDYVTSEPAIDYAANVILLLALL
jgi:endoglucanase